MKLIAVILLFVLQVGFGGALVYAGFMGIDPITPLATFKSKLLMVIGGVFLLSGLSMLTPFYRGR